MPVGAHVVPPMVTGSVGSDARIATPPVPLTVRCRQG